MSSSEQYLKDTKGGGRSRGSTSRKPRDVSSEVRRLIASGKSDMAVLGELRGKFGNDDDMVNAAFDGYKDRLEFITRKSRKFKQLILDRYSKYNLTFPQLMKKAKKYADKYDLASDEFDLFVKQALSQSTYSQQAMNMLPNTAMSRTLGQSQGLAASDKLNVRNDELDILQDILRIHGSTKTLHSQIVLQSLTYEDCAKEALVGKFDRSRDNPYSYVHPILAALFLPRIAYFDEHMLIASIANIIKCKHDGKPILTAPEYELHWDLITDPNDTVCDMESPMRDLKNRVELQTRLWDSVMNLRQGKYFKDNLSEFLVAVDNCRNNIYDVPDLSYVKDEGSIVRRLLAAFSMRPTIVRTMPLYGTSMSSNPHINVGSLAQFSTLPMITVRIPLHGNTVGSDYTSYGEDKNSLQASLDSGHWYVENRMIVPKIQNVLHSRDVLLFYVNRRYQHVTMGRFTGPYNFNNLPMTVSGFERINQHKLDFSDDNIKLPGDADKNKFSLKSLVSLVITEANMHISGKNDTNTHIITGCDAYIKTKNAAAEWVHYNPTNIGQNDKPFSTMSGTEFMDKTSLELAPIAKKDPRDNLDGADGNVLECRGTVYIYQKDE